MACFVAGAAPHLVLVHGASAALPAMTKRGEPPQVQVSDFDRVCALGHGGFAGVSLVRHRRTGDVFAFKKAFSPSPHAKEEAEVLRRAAMSPSPFVVRCHAVFLDDDGRLASVLEFMDAGSLLDVLRRSEGRGFREEPVLAEVAGRCLMGLAHLHTRGIAHLDVKADNFLANSRGEIKINDFNTSRIVFGCAGESRQVPTVMGTISHFSPERFVPNGHFDSRSAMAADVWAFGLTILDLFLGRPSIRPAAKVPKAKDWMQTICNWEPPSVPADAKASPELRDFVAACLQKDPTLRPRVTELLRHPFVMCRDVAASSRALRQLVLKKL